MQIQSNGLHPCDCDVYRILLVIQNLLKADSCTVTYLLFSTHKSSKIIKVHLQLLIYDMIMNKLVIHVLLFQTPDLCHSVVSTTTFRAEYRRSGSSSVFSRNVRFQVDITPAHGTSREHESSMYCLTFTHISGKRRLCQLCIVTLDLQSLLTNS